jgi:DnaJ like chaperone protein
MTALLIAFVTGGAQGLASFLGTLLYVGFITVLALFAIFFGFTFWLQKKVRVYEQSQTESHKRFVWLLVQILIHTAKIDGQITKAEITTIHRFFQLNLHYNQTQMAWIKDLVKEAINTDQSLDALLQEFKTTFAYEPRLILLELVYQVLYTKTEVPEEELKVARHIANSLEIPEYVQRTVEGKYRYRQYGGTSAPDLKARHLATLGLESGASAEEIKKAYRKLSMQYHPDKVRHLGEEFRAVAEEKMKEINAAYDFLEKNP